MHKTHFSERYLQLAKGDVPMKALLIYPSIPDTFWSFKHIMKFIRKKAAHVPSGAAHGGRHVSQGLGP